MKRTNSKPAKGTAKAITDKPKGQVSTSRKRDLKLHEEMAAVTPAPTRFRKNATPLQRVAAVQVALRMLVAYSSHPKGMLPSLADPNWRKSFLQIIEHNLRPKNLTDALHSEHIADLADAMIKRSEGTANLDQLLTELELGIISVQGLIDEHGGDALLITPFDPDQE